MTASILIRRASIFLIVALIPSVLAFNSQASAQEADRSEDSMQPYFLEIVTPEVDAVCTAYTAATGVEFGDPQPAIGNARTAPLAGEGMVSVRAPLRESEEPVVRPYWLVDDIETAVANAVEAGAFLAHPPLEIPGYGTFAIYILGSVEHGLWQR